MSIDENVEPIQEVRETDSGTASLSTVSSSQQPLQQSPPQETQPSSDNARNDQSTPPNQQIAADSTPGSELQTPTVSQSATPEPEDVPKKAKRLTLQERLALAAKKKKAQKDAAKPADVSSEPKNSSVTPKSPVEGNPQNPETKEAAPTSQQTSGTEAMSEKEDRRTQELEQQVEELRQKLIEAERKAKSAKVPESDKKSEDIDRKLAEKDKLIQQLMEEGQELSKKELRSNEKIKTLVTTNNKLENSLRNYAEKNSETLLKLGEIEGILQKHKFKTIEHFMSHVTELKDKVSVLEADLDRTQKDDWQTKYVEQVRLFSSEAEQRKTAENKLSEVLLQSELARNQFELALQSKDDIIEGLNKDISHIKGENASELSRLETKIELLRSENENFLKYSQGKGTDSESTAKDASSSDADYIKLSENHRNLQSQYLSSQENWKTIEMNFLSKIESLSESVQSYQTAKQKTAAELKRLHGKISMQDDQMDKLKNENSKLQESLKESEFQLKMKVNELADLEEKFEEVTTIFNSDRANYNLKIEALSQEIRSLNTQLEDLQSQSSFGQSRKFRDSGLFIDMKPPLRSHGSQVSSYSLTPNINGPGSIVGQQLQWDEGYQRSRDNSIHERPTNERHDRNNSIYDRSSVYDERNTSSHSLLEEIYPSQSPDAADQSIMSGIPSSAGATKNIQMLSKMSSTVRRLETEIMTLKEENESLAVQKNSAQMEIVDRTELLDKITQLESEVNTLKAEMEVKAKNEETLLEVIGEKSERVEELKADVADLKDLLRSQVQQMIEMQGK